MKKILLIFCALLFSSQLLASREYCDMFKFATEANKFICINAAHPIPFPIVAACTSAGLSWQWSEAVCLDLWIHPQTAFKCAKRPYGISNEIKCLLNENLSVEYGPSKNYKYEYKEDQ